MGSITVICLQNRILFGAAAAPELASSLISAVFNLGIAAGAALGSQALECGVPVGALPLISVGFAVAASLLAVAATRGVRIVHVEPNSPADVAGLRTGDLVITVGGRPVDDAQALQRRMFADAIDVPLPITTFRNGAMVDVIARPVELVDQS